MSGSAHKLPTALPRKRRSSLIIPEQAAKAAAVRMWQSVVVDGVAYKERRMITPAAYGMLDVDPSYQRGRTDMVQQIIVALQRGGTIPDLPAVAERSFGPRDGKLWIMDGFQRVSALMELDRAFEVNVWVTDSLDAERKFFLALNNRRALNVNTQVKAWAGPSTELLAYLNAREGALQGRISFDRAGGERLPSGILLRGIVVLLSGSRGHAEAIQRALSKADGLLKDDAAKRKATAFCTLVGAVWPKGHPLQMPVLALAEVACEYWAGAPRDPRMPTQSQLSKLQGLNWRTALPSMASVYTDLAISIIKRAWK